MKRNLTLTIFAVLMLVLATGCERGNRRLEDNPTDSPQAAATEVPAQPTMAPTYTMAPTATEMPVEASATPIPTATAAPSVSQSDQTADQLNVLLDQLDKQLGGIDTLEDTPPAP